MELARQFALLAQGSDGWENIIFLVIMGVFWLLGALAKVRSSKKGDQQQQRHDRSAPQAARPRETWQQRIARKAQEIQRALEAQQKSMEQQGRTRPQTAQPHPAGEITVRTDQHGDSVMVYQSPAMTQEQQAARQRKAKEAIAAAQQAMIEPSRPPEAVEISEEPSTPSSDLHVTELIDYSDPDALKKAVLHYEIFGRPLALRDPSQEETTAF